MNSKELNLVQEGKEQMLNAKREGVCLPERDFIWYWQLFKPPQIETEGKHSYTDTNTLIDTHTNTHTHTERERERQRQRERETERETERERD